MAIKFRDWVRKKDAPNTVYMVRGIPNKQSVIVSYPYIFNGEIYEQEIDYEKFDKNYLFAKESLEKVDPKTLYGIRYSMLECENYEKGLILVGKERNVVIYVNSADGCDLYAIRIRSTNDYNRKKVASIEALSEVKDIGYVGDYMLVGSPEEAKEVVLEMNWQPDRNMFLSGATDHWFLPPEKRPKSWADTPDLYNKPISDFFKELLKGWGKSYPILQDIISQMQKEGKLVMPSTSRTMTRAEMEDMLAFIADMLTDPDVQNRQVLVDQKDVLEMLLM